MLNEWNQIMFIYWITILKAIIFQAKFRRLNKQIKRPINERIQIEMKFLSNLEINHWLACIFAE